MTQNEPKSDHDILILLDQKVDGLHIKVDKLTDDHETRIRALEKNQWRWSGIAGVLGAGLTLLASEAISALHK